MLIWDSASSRFVALWLPWLPLVPPLSPSLARGTQELREKTHFSVFFLEARVGFPLGPPGPPWVPLAAKKEKMDLLLRNGG